jgi:transformation/transcription domain-associated protein
LSLWSSPADKAVSSRHRSQKDEAKLKAAQELSDNFDQVLASAHFQQFLAQAMQVFLKLLSEGRPHFIAEYNVQQVRKLVLEMIQRFPANDFLKPYAKSILSLAFKVSHE